jgi:hypothetical protein
MVNVIINTYHIFLNTPRTEKKSQPKSGVCVAYSHIVDIIVFQYVTICLLS